MKRREGMIQHQRIIIAWIIAGLMFFCAVVFCFYAVEFRSWRQVLFILLALIIALVSTYSALRFMREENETSSRNR
jgi:multidrug efflux pump subunit AcrB